MMGVDMMVMVIVMIHHGDTLYHDQADTAPLLGTDPAVYLLIETEPLGKWMRPGGVPIT